MRERLWVGESNNSHHPSGSSVRGTRKSRKPASQNERVETGAEKPARHQHHRTDPEPRGAPWPRPLVAPRPPACLTPVRPPPGSRPRPLRPGPAPTRLLAAAAALPRPNGAAAASVM